MFSSHFLTPENTTPNLILLFYSNSFITSSCKWFHEFTNQQAVDVLTILKHVNFLELKMVLKVLGLKSWLDISLNTNIQRLMAGNFIGTIKYLHSKRQNLADSIYITVDQYQSTPSTRPQA